MYLKIFITIIILIILKKLFYNRKKISPKDKCILVTGAAAGIGKALKFYLNR